MNVKGLGIEGLKGVVWVIATAFAVFFFFDNRYVHAEDANKTHLEIRKDMIVSELRQLSAKEKTSKLETWEKIRQEDLERQLKDLMKK